MSNTTFQITNDQYDALKQAKEVFGRQWKSNLRTYWETGRYPSSLGQDKADLQMVHNQGGGHLTVMELSYERGFDANNVAAE